MADNTVIPAGSGGDTIATDDIGGIKHQRAKVGWGADGSYGDASAANPLPVDDDAAQALLTSIKTAVEILDNIVAGSEAQVDVLTLPALPAGTNNIGDVDVLTLPADPLGANADAAASAGGTGSISAKLRNATALLDSIKTATETLDNAIAGSEIQADVITVPADPFGANADAAVAAGATGSIQAKLRRVTQGLEDLKTLIVLGAGSAVIGKVDHATTGLGSGRKIVTTAGTRVALAGSTAAKWVTITAETDNTGYVVVGSAAGVIAALATREGTPLAAGDSVTLAVDNLADVGLDSTVSGDGTTFSYGT